MNRQLKNMLLNIEEEALLTADYTGRSKFSDKVMEAIASVPRHEFVDSEQVRLAYLNAPLPISASQTISQPYIVALMTDMLELDENNTVLEIGTGSGYQTAILAELVKQVYSIEIIEALYTKAKSQLESLGYTNIKMKRADGYFGWDEFAPFDKIIVTAAINEIPPCLISQLKNNGKMIIPVEDSDYRQNLVLLEKDETGNISTRTVLPVAFVPFTRSKE